MDIIHPAIVKNGKVVLKQSDNFHTFVAGLEGKQVEVIVREFKNKKSDNQNRFYWGVLMKMLADETGNDPMEIHNACKMMFLPDKTLSTNQLTTLEMEGYNEKIRNYFASEWNIQLPYPGQIDW